MRVQDVMSKDVKCCCPETNLAHAAATMWEGDCGILPVVDEERQVKGVITDRDIAIAVGTRGGQASEIKVGDVAPSKVFTCRTEDAVEDALETMRVNKVVRLPVVDPNGRLQGLLSIGDIVSRATRTGGVTAEDVIDAMKTISGHRPSAVRPSRRGEALVKIP